MLTLDMAAAVLRGMMWESLKYKFPAAAEIRFGPVELAYPKRRTGSIPAPGVHLDGATDLAHQLSRHNQRGS